MHIDQHRQHSRLRCYRPVQLIDGQLQPPADPTQYFSSQLHRRLHQIGDRVSPAGDVPASTYRDSHCNSHRGRQRDERTTWPSGVTTDGTVIATIGADVATNGPATECGVEQSGQTDHFRQVQATVTINQAATQANPTNVSPVNFTVVLNEPPSPASPQATISQSPEQPPRRTPSFAGAEPATSMWPSRVTTRPGTVIASIGAGGILDLPAMPTLVHQLPTHLVTSDHHTPPEVTINQAWGAPQCRPTTRP